MTRPDRSETVHFELRIPPETTPCSSHDCSLAHGAPAIQLAVVDTLVEPRHPSAEAMRPLQAGQRLGEYTGEARRYDLWCEEIKVRGPQSRVMRRAPGVGSRMGGWSRHR